MLYSAFWLIALVAFVVIEGVTVGLVSIWFAVGALGGLIVAMLGGHILTQILVFIVLSGLSMALVRPMVKKFLKPRYSPTNADRVIGQTAVVTEEINNIEGRGAVSVAGHPWTARCQQNLTIPVGTQVRVLRIEGVKVFVEPLP